MTRTINNVFEEFVKFWNWLPFKDMDSFYHNVGIFFCIFIVGYVIHRIYRVKMK